MADKYLLSCEACSKDIEIEPKNAGNLVRCISCSKKMTAPTMREIRQLERVRLPESDEPSVRKRSISTAGRWGFLFGVLLLVGGIGTAAAIKFTGEKLNTEIPEYRLTNKDSADLENLPPSQLVGLWDSLVGSEVPEEWKEHPLRKNQRTAAAKHQTMLIGLGVAGIGLLVALGSLFLKR